MVLLLVGDLGDSIVPISRIVIIGVVARSSGTLGRPFEPCLALFL